MKTRTARLALSVLLRDYDGGVRCDCMSKALLGTVDGDTPEDTVRRIAWCSAGHPDDDWTTA